MNFRKASFLEEAGVKIFFSFWDHKRVGAITASARDRNKKFLQTEIIYTKKQIAIQKIAIYSSDL